MSALTPYRSGGPLQTPAVVIYSHGIIEHLVSLGSIKDAVYGCRGAKGRHGDQE